MNMTYEEIKESLINYVKDLEQQGFIYPRTLECGWTEYEWGKMKFTSTEEDMQNGLMKAEIVLYQPAYHINLMEDNN